MFRIWIQQFTISADPGTDPYQDFAITLKVRFVCTGTFLLNLFQISIILSNKDKLN
jgi:hypothetical protein